MKKILVLATIVAGLVSSAFAVEYKIPYDYRLLKSLQYGALQVYKKGDIYVSVINLNKANVKVGNVDKTSSNLFVKHSLSTWWNDCKNPSTLAMYNGQFFSMNGYLTSSTTTLSFPLRSYWHTINSSKDYGSLRTLYIDNYGNTKIYPNYSSRYLNSTKELIVGLSPYTNKSSNKKIGRFYIVGIPKTTGNPYYKRNMKYLLFFTSKKSTQNEIISEIYRWNGAKANTIMMDGSGSAQMRVGSLKVYGNGFPKYRHLPNIISIEKK